MHVVTPSKKSKKYYYKNKILTQPLHWSKSLICSITVKKIVRSDKY
jgi:hypothetical protein